MKAVKKQTEPKQDPTYTLHDWKREVRTGDTRLGYEEWVKEKRTEVQNMKLVKGKPKVGDLVYIPTSLYIDHGEDDFLGGICKVKGFDEHGMITVVERPGSSYSLNYVMEHQEKWQKEYGKRRGHEDPDYG